jgi:hypothetical protein
MKTLNEIMASSLPMITKLAQGDLVESFTLNLTALTPITPPNGEKPGYSPLLELQFGVTPRTGVNYSITLDPRDYNTTMESLIEQVKGKLPEYSISLLAVNESKF